MLQDFIKNFDFFSQSIEFNSSKQSIRKRTLFGASLTIIIIVLSIFYFIYLIIQYSTDQIEPKFRSQTFATSELIDIPLENNFMGMQIKQLEGNLTLSEMQKLQNKTYLTFIPLYQKKEGSSFTRIFLDLIQCEDPQLEGYLCFDLKNLPDKKVVTGTQNSIYSMVSFFVYKCQETDHIKTFVPDNCASPEEIDEFISETSNIIDIKIKTSQYNITSHQMQVSYKHQYMFMSSPKQIQYTEFRIQKQISSVKEGAFIQQESQYSSPISYVFNQQLVEKTDKQLNNFIFQFTFDVDETIQQIKIQYATFPELLAQCNSAIALLMSLGFLGKFMAKKLIRQEIFILILKTLYQETHQKILRLNNIQHFRDIYPQQIKFSPFKSDYVLEEGIDPVLMPSLQIKSGEQILTQQSSQTNGQIDDTKKQSVLNLKKNDSINKKYLAIEQSIDRSQIQLETRNEESKSIPKVFQQIIKDKKLNHTFQMIQHYTSESQKVSQNKNKKSIAKQKQQNIQTNQIKKENREQYLKNVHDRINSQKDIEVTKKTEKALFKFRNQQKNFEFMGLNKKAVSKIEQDISNSLDFIQFYKEIILLKKAIMMILSKDQYAALSIIGCKDNHLCNENDYVDQMTCKQLVYFQKSKKFVFFKSAVVEQDKIDNYFQEQLQISESDDLQTYFIHQFIEKCNNHQANISQIDQRIYSSLI